MKHCSHYLCVIYGGPCPFRREADLPPRTWLGKYLAGRRRQESEKACCRMIGLTSRLTAKHKREMRDYLQAVIELDERTAAAEAAKKEP